MTRLSVAYKEHDDYLEVVATGRYDLQEAMATVPAALSACRRLGLTNVLVDYRELKGVAAITQKILFSVDVLDKHNAYVAGGGLPLRIAYLGSPDLVTAYQPGAEIANRNGMDVKLFTDEDEARRWLGV